MASERSAHQVIRVAGYTGILRTLTIVFAIALSNCVSPPVTYTAQEFELMKDHWRPLFEEAETLCQTETEHTCAQLNVLALDIVLQEGRHALSVDSYEALWTREQDYRSKYGIAGKLGDDAPVPATPSELADSRARERAAYERQQDFLSALAGTAGAGRARPSAWPTSGNGIPVYDASQCVGPIIMGKCHGSTIGPPRKTCHGTMLNGQCTGPMF